MASRARVTLAVVAALLWASNLPAYGQTPDTSGDLETAQEGYDEAVANEAAVLAEFDAQMARAQALTDQVAALDAELAVAEAELSSAQAMVDAADADLADAQRRLADTEAELARQEEILRTQAVEAYMGAGGPDIRTRSMLSAGSAADAEESVVYAGVVVEGQEELIESFRTLQAEATSLRSETAVARDAAAAARDEVAARRDGLAATRSQQATAQTEAIEALRTQQDLLTEVQATRNDYLERIAALTAASDGIGQFLAGQQSGQVLPDMTARIYGHPVDPMSVASPFGPRMHPVFHEMRLHRGADLNAGQGQPIHAAGDGVVVIAEVRGGYGNCVVVDHGNGLATLYAHQSEMQVKRGDVVKRGDQIGLVGATGVATGPHLHFEVRVFGDAVDPVPFLEPF